MCTSRCTTGSLPASSFSAVAAEMEAMAATAGPMTPSVVMVGTASAGGSGPRTQRRQAVWPGMMGMDMP